MMELLTLESNFLLTEHGCILSEYVKIQDACYWSSENPHQLRKRLGEIKVGIWVCSYLQGSNCAALFFLRRL
jgi:hypothetical protein